MEDSVTRRALRACVACAFGRNLLYMKGPIQWPVTWFHGMA